MWIKCRATLALLKQMLTVGSTNEKGQRVGRKGFGTPQGNILSPLLSNIVLHEFDDFMAKTKKRFDKGNRRVEDPRYRLARKRRENSNISDKKKENLQIMRSLPRYDPFDPTFRRLAYIRYADDFVIMVAGSKDEAKAIKSEVASFLKQACGLTLSPEKSLISNLTKS